MAKVYITEYGALGDVLGNPLMAAQTPPLVEQAPVAIGASSVQSASFNAATRLIRVHTDAICSYLVGSNPTATANNARLAADQTEYLAVLPGHKIAIITNT